MTRHRIAPSARVTLIAVLVLAAALSVGARQASQGQTFLFSYFTGNGEDGLHLARSEDGRRWQTVAGGRSFLMPSVGSRLMRDPSITRGPDGRFHLVWTTGWWDQGFGVAHSDDLKTWTAQAFVPVLEQTPGVLNVWAPEIFFDDGTGSFLVIWASTIRGRFPETADVGDTAEGGRLNHRLYVTTTRDFVTWTPARLFYDGGFSAIDGVLVRDAARVVLVVKDETRYPTPRKHLKVATAATAFGPFGPASPAFSPDWVEGPTVLRLGDVWRVYFDEYTRKRYGAMDTRDFRTFVPVTETVFPEGMRHGTALQVPRETMDRLEP